MKKAHFIGICGAGMSAVAKLLKDTGVEISGSDEGFYPPVSDYLTRVGLPCVPHYAKENIPKDADIIVIGKHAKLIPEENEEVKMAVESGIPIKSFPEILGELTLNNTNIIVAGSFGKSTCTSLIAWALESSGKDPGFFIGAIPETPNVSSKMSGGDVFVLEGDEYPTSNWDSTSKFLHLNPTHILLTSLTHDHLNVFPTPESYLAPFKKLLEITPPQGVIVGSRDDEQVCSLLRDIKNSVLYSASQEADWMVKNIQWGETTSFDIWNKGDFVIRVETTLLGIHNIQNIVGAAAILLENKLLTSEEFAQAMKSFKGLKRRLDLKSKDSTVKVYEGFGSSYPKAQSAIAAIKQHFPERRLIIVFEPHTFSWRNREALPWYDDIFLPADSIFIYKPPTHGASTHDQLTLEEIVERVKKSRTRVHGFEDPGSGFDLLQKKMKADDIVLMLTSGDLGGLIEKIPQFAEEKFQRK